MKPKRAAIYVRVSTDQQDTAMQEAELLEYAQRRDWETKIYRDAGQSGAKESRPALNLLLSDVRRRRIDVVLVSTLDRLARSLKQLLSLAEEFQSLGIDLCAMNQAIDTSSASGRFAYQLLSSVSEFEREILRERVRAGLAQARRIGKHLGRPPLRRFDQDEVKKLCRLRRQGMSVRKLAIQHGTTQYVIAKLTDATSKKHSLFGAKK
jgi:DNA invertase Pin-like site-specific DNA recombinase